MAESRTGAAGDLGPAAEVSAAEVPAGVIALRLRGVSKTFPGVRALTAVDMDVAAGSVHALVGHNGSGKSTLINAWRACTRPTRGRRPGSRARY